MDLNQIRNDFPTLQEEVNGKRLAYFDSGASALKPRVVMDRLAQFYEKEYSNVHRGVHYLSQGSTLAFEAVRGKVQTFLNAAREDEIIFTAGTTESINLIAYSYVLPYLGKSDAILISEMEHHSNIVPWQLIAKMNGMDIKVVPVLDNGALDMQAFDNLLTPDVKFVSITHVSNTLGTVNPVKEIIEKAHANGSKVLVDGAQAAPHMTVDMQELGCDFYVFSAHKVFGPTGVGVLYGKFEVLDQVKPWQGGGDMIETVSFEGTTFNVLPHRLEAGTPNIAGVIGFGEALDYLAKIDVNWRYQHELNLLDYAMKGLKEFPQVRVLGTVPGKAAVICFVIDGVHAHDVGSLMDMNGVSVRVGHHCTEPLMKRFKVPATARASISFYNNKEDIDQWLSVFPKIFKFFG